MVNHFETLSVRDSLVEIENESAVTFYLWVCRIVSYHSIPISSEVLNTKQNAASAPSTWLHPPMTDHITPQSADTQNNADIRRTNFRLSLRAIQKDRMKERQRRKHIQVKNKIRSPNNQYSRNEVQIMNSQKRLESLQGANGNKSHNEQPQKQF